MINKTLFNFIKDFKNSVSFITTAIALDVAAIAFAATLVLDWILNKIEIKGGEKSRSNKKTGPR